ncbi:MAG: tRNA (adenosine(37)-N6)-threonylcarbamoyltransferase complex ATPase subunit type 1 TsaE [Candidatus Taylorbacteria bacterium]
MKTYSSTSLEETQKIAREWLADISSRYADRDEALVVGLSGHLGAGKTAFSKAVAQELGITETVTSPTFVIMKAYEVQKNREPRDKNPKGTSVTSFPWKRFVHIDAYRLERREELEALQWERLVTDKNNLILIEWPENVGLKEFVPLGHLDFEIKEGKHEVMIR